MKIRVGGFLEGVIGQDADCLMVAVLSIWFGGNRVMVCDDHIGLQSPDAVDEAREDAILAAPLRKCLPGGL